MIQMQALRVFVTVARCRNIRDAGKALSRTDSAISMTLKQLEGDLGAPLFETDRKHTLTMLGIEVNKLAQDLLREYDRTTERIVALAEGRAGVLRIAAVPSVAAQLLPPVLSAMLVDHPGVQIELLDTDSASVHALVETGVVELGIGGKPEASAGLEFVALFNDPFRLVCRKDHPLAGLARPLTRQDVLSHRLISNKSTAGYSDFDADGRDGCSALSARNVISLLALVRAGAGATILPALATQSIDEDLCALELHDPSALRTVGFVWRRGCISSPICAAFQDRLVSSIQKSDITGQSVVPDKNQDQA